MRIWTLAVAILALAFTTIARADDEKPHRSVNVHNHGAKCNGQHDDTQAFREAITQAAAGGVVFVPPGRCVISDTLIINNTMNVSLIGSGRASQVYQRSNKTLLSLRGVNAVMVKDLYLGSAATAAGTSLIEMINSHHNRIENVSMLGSYYGLRLFGSLLNTMIDLRSGTNFQGFFAATSTNQYWVHASRDNANRISSNSNTFVAPVLEGGTNGIVINDLPDPSCAGCLRNGEGSIHITGGSIEGVSGTALLIDRTFQASSVTGVHFEANGADVVINNAWNVRLTAVNSISGPGGSGVSGIRLQGTNTKTIQISDSIVQQLIADMTVRRLQLQNITTDLQCTGTSGILPPTPWDASVIYTNVGLNCQ
jgi:Pectate lyase superfamily protein